MKNFLFVLLSLLLCVYLISGRSVLTKRDLHRIILREEIQRPKSHRSHHHNDHKHKDHEEHHDEELGKHRENDSSESSSFSASHENSYEHSGSKNKGYPLRKPTRSPYYTTTEKYRDKRQKQELSPSSNFDNFSSNLFGQQNLNFQRSKSEYAKHNVPKYPDTFHLTIASSENLPHYYKFNHRNINYNHKPKAQKHLKDNNYQVYEDASFDTSIFVPNTQLLRPTYNIKQQLSAEVINASNNTNKERIKHTRKRKVLRQRRRKVESKKG